MNLNQPTAVRALKENFVAKPINQVVPVIDWYISLRRFFSDAHMFFSRPTFKLILLIFGMAFLGCQKDRIKDTIIKGRLTEFGTAESIRVAGLKIALYRHSSELVFLPSDSKIAEVSTDENGEFSLAVEIDENPAAYYIKLLESPPGYYRIHHAAYLKSKISNSLELSLNRQAWLKVVLNNEGGGLYDYFVFAINNTTYSHTGGGKPSVIQRVPSYYSNLITIGDFRTNPETISYYEKVLTPNDTIAFEIDLRRQ